MSSILHNIAEFFKAEKHVYSHRHRTIEIVAEEHDIDIDTIRQQTLTDLEKLGRTEAIIRLTHRFHVPLSSAWIFVDRLDHERSE